MCKTLSLGCRGFFYAPCCIGPYLLWNCFVQDFAFVPVMSDLRMFYRYRLSVRTIRYLFNRQKYRFSGHGVYVVLDACVCFLLCMCVYFIFLLFYDAAATLSGNSLRQTAHTHCASVHQAAKLVAALLRVAGITAGLAESNGSLPPGLWLTSPAGWLPRTGISSGTLRSVIEYGLPLPFLWVESSADKYQDHRSSAS